NIPPIRGFVQVDVERIRSQQRGALSECFGFRRGKGPLRNAAGTGHRRARLVISPPRIHGEIGTPRTSRPPSASSKNSPSSPSPPDQSMLAGPGAGEQGDRRIPSFAPSSARLYLHFLSFCLSSVSSASIRSQFSSA